VIKYLALLIYLPLLLFAQPETINPEHPVYLFLKKAHIRGLIQNYDSYILPKSIGEIKSLLVEIDLSKSELSNSEIVELERYIAYFINRNEKEIENVGFLISDDKSFFLKYEDSLIVLGANPIFHIKSLFSPGKFSESNTGYNLGYGAKVELSYSDWFYSYVAVKNGNTYGSRDVNSLDTEVKQKYSFWHTKLNNFDDTEGGFFLNKDIFSFSISRQRTLWGYGFSNKPVLSDVSQKFDKIGFSINHKYFSYEYLHGWLVTPYYYLPGDSISGDLKLKDAKYIAQNRISLKFIDNLILGMTQTVVYAGRPFELAYINPFLFWESAQRSMNDLDNSFLTLDISYNALSSFEIYSSLTFDDINFDFLSPGKFDSYGNRFSAQIGMFFNFKSLPWLSGLLEYNFIRPYTYSHYAFGENLAYLNNSYPLGLNLKPNSDMTNLRIMIDPIPFINIYLDIKYSQHGENETDTEGNLIRNVGGSFFYSTNYKSTEIAKFLDGVYQKNIAIQAGFIYDYSNLIKISLRYLYNSEIYDYLTPKHFLEAKISITPY
jgi:hypothetical protein